MTNSDSLFKSLLNVVRVEASLGHEGSDVETSKNSFPKKESLAIIEALDLLKKELSIGNQIDCNTLTGHFLKSMVRLSQSQGLTEPESSWSKHQIKILILIIDCLVAYFDKQESTSLYTSGQHTTQLNHSILEHLQSISYISALIAEHLKAKLIAGMSGLETSQGNKLSPKMIFHADYECLVNSLFQLINTFFGTTRAHFKLNDPRKGTESMSNVSTCIALFRNPAVDINDPYNSFLHSIAQHILSQLVHTCIVFLTASGAHPSTAAPSSSLSSSAASNVQHNSLISKTTVIYALSALEQLLVTFSYHRTFWRQSLPGIFSGLCKLLHQDYYVYRGNQVLSQGLKIMILLLYCICQDEKIPENELLINFIANSSNDASSGQSGGETDKLKALLFQAAEVTKNQNSSPSSSNLQEISEFKSLQAFQEWRVNVLQHIKQPFHSSYRNVMPYIQDQQRFEIIQLVYQSVFVDCYQFLGKVFIQEFFFLYVASLQDSFPPIRKFVRNTLGEMFSTWIRESQGTGNISKGLLIYSELIQQCQAIYFQSISSLPVKIGKLSSAQLQYELSTLVSLSTYDLLGKSTLQEILVWNESLSMMKLVSTLFAVNIPQALKQQVIDKRIYLPFQDKSAGSDNTDRNMEVCYYSIPLRYAESDAVKQLLQQLASSSFKYTNTEQSRSTQRCQSFEDTVLNAILDRFEKWKKRIFYAIQYTDRHGKVRDSVTAAGASDTAEGSMEEEIMKESFQKYCQQDIQWFLSVWNYFRFASFGYVTAFAKLVKEEKPEVKPVTKEDEQFCAFCSKGKEVTGGKLLLRCSQCKSVFYCSKEHQKSHWPLHKGSCKKPTLVVPTNEKEMQSSEPAMKKICEQTKEDPEEFYTLQECALGGGKITVHSYASTRRSLEMIDLCNSFMDHYLCLFENSYLSILWSEYQLIIAMILELLADIFPTMIYEQYQQAITPVLYNMIEIASIHGENGTQYQNKLVATAAISSLERISLYLGYDSFQSFLSAHMDYIVDKTCSILRNSLYFITHPHSSMASAPLSTANNLFTTKSFDSRYNFSAIHYNVRSLAAHKVIAFVLFHTIHHNNSSAPNSASHDRHDMRISCLRSVMKDLLEHLDTQVLAASTTDEDGERMNDIKSSQGGLLASHNIVMNMMKVIQLLVHSIALPSSSENKQIVGDMTLSEHERMVEKLYQIFSPEVVKEKFVSVESGTGRQSWQEDIHQLYLTQKTRQAAVFSAEEKQQQIVDPTIGLDIWKSYCKFHQTLKALSSTSSSSSSSSFGLQGKRTEEKGEEESKESTSRNMHEDDVDEQGTTGKELSDYPEEIQLLRLIAMEKCRYCLHFSFHLPAQVLVIDTLIGIVLRIQTLTGSKKIILPMIHGLWTASLLPVQQLVQTLYQRVVQQYSTSIQYHQHATTKNNKEHAVARQQHQVQQTRGKLEFYDKHSFASAGNSSMNESIPLLASTTTSAMVLLHQSKTSSEGTTSTTTSTTRESPSNSQDRSLYLLPKYFELYTVLFILQPSFVFSKLRTTSFLTSLLSFFQIYHIQYMLGAGSSSTTAAAAVRPSSNIHERDHIHNKNRLDFQVKYACLQFVYHLFEISDDNHHQRNVVNMELLQGMNTYTIVWIWYLLPFCTSSQGEEVRLLGKSILKALAKREPIYLSSLWQCLQLHPPLTTTEMKSQQEKEWLQLVYDPRLYSIDAVQHPAGVIFTATTNNTTSKKNGNLFYNQKQKEQLWLQLRDQYNTDKQLMEILEQCVRENDDLLMHGDSLWQYHYLPKFATI